MTTLAWTLATFTLLAVTTAYSTALILIGRRLERSAILKRFQAAGRRMGKSSSFHQMMTQIDLLYPPKRQ